MTSPTSSKPARKTGASRNSKVLSASLAVATGVGVAGMVAVRMAQDASAQDTVPVSSATQSQDTGVATSSDGYTKDQLDAYAQALATEAIRLQDYRDQLAAVASNVTSNVTSKSVKPLAAPKVQQPKPAPQTQQQAAPQAKSKSS